MIGMVYFISWASYWISVLYVGYVDLFELRPIKPLFDEAEHTTIILVYLTHIFSYMNAATNWVIYWRTIIKINENSVINNINEKLVI